MPDKDGNIKGIFISKELPWHRGRPVENLVSVIREVRESWPVGEDEDDGPEE
jgi:hypothetical protein